MPEKNFFDDVVDSLVGEIGDVASKFEVETPFGMVEKTPAQAARQYGNYRTVEGRRAFRERITQSYVDQGLSEQDAQRKAVADLMKMAGHLAEAKKERFKT